MNCQYISENECTGCGLCSQICPNSAIIMEEDFDGFLKPKINNALCSNCSKCSNICRDYLKQTQNKNVILEVKACQTNNPIWKIESTAGGFFPTLAQWVIENGGVVFGTAYDEDMNAIICKCCTIEEIKKLNGSKYVQSVLHIALNEIKHELNKGNIVLFSGTPCQNAAVKTFCNDINNEKLITLDVICYGVPSPKLFKSYIKIIEEKYHAKVTDFRFRDKHKYGWSHTTVIKLNKNGKESQIIEKDFRKIPYYRMFGKRDCFRKSCYYCKFNTIERITDFTTGNFWKIENYTSLFNTYDGVSMVLLNTKKAINIYKNILPKIKSLNMNIEQAIQSNEALIKSSIYPNNRDYIYSYFSKYGFKKMYKRYYPINYFKIIYNYLKNLIL